VQNIPPDDRAHGWKRRYARKLAAMMAEEARTNKEIKPLGWASIQARLSEQAFWPNAK
jgi:hypothetical protein